MRIVVGGCGFQLWVLESTQKLSLQLMTLSVESTQAETAKGVRIKLSSAAQIKIRANMADNDSEIDTVRVKKAAQHFLGRKETEIVNAVHRTMEGHQRQIIGTLTVEELYKERAAFSARVRELVEEDLGQMGFQLVSYTVTDIDDEMGYITALGATQTAVVKREAEEGQAKNEAQARITVARTAADAQMNEAESSRNAQVRKNEYAQAEAESARDLQLKQQSYQKEVNEAKAKAEAAIRIETAIQDQAVIKQRTLQQVEEANVMLMVADKEVERKKREADGESGAELLRARNDAEAKKVAADAAAYKVKADGEAHATAVQRKGEAEAAVLTAKADAYSKYGEAAMAQLIVKELPAIAEAVAAPLAKTEKMVFVSGDGSSASRLTTDISNIMSSLPETVHSLTGVDLNKIVKRLEGQGPEAARVAADVNAFD